MSDKSMLIILAGIVSCLLLGSYCYGKDCYKDGYSQGYDAGWAAAQEQLPKAQKPDTVEAIINAKTETVTAIRPKTSPTEPAVIVKTEAPKVEARVNGKTYEFKPKTEVLDTSVKTTASLNIRIPERRWKLGIGIDNRKKPAYMLSAPIKGAVGVWVAGSDKDRIMGGVSISF